MFKYRVITALIFIPLILLAIWKLPLLFFGILMAGVVAIAAWEWASLAHINSLLGKSLYTFLSLILLILVQFIPLLSIFFMGFIAQLWLFIEICHYQATGKSLLLKYNLVRALFGLVLLTSFWFGLMVLKGPVDKSAVWLLYLVLMVWFVDTGAYFIGKKWGKHKFVSKVSPNKTWEGFIGGVFVSTLAAIAFSFILPITNAYLRVEILAITVIAILFSVSGDLAISLLKRLAAIKNTGKLFPGHGGMLDRIDSLIAAVVVFSLLLHWV